jgi:hypothetical protein
MGAENADDLSSVGFARSYITETDLCHRLRLTVPKGKTLCDAFCTAPWTNASRQEEDASDEQKNEEAVPVAIL